MFAPAATCSGRAECVTTPPGTTPDTRIKAMSEAKATLLPWGSANKHAYRWTRLAGRLTVWTPQLVARLAVLWSAGFHHETISDVLDVGPRAASSKASRIGLPARGTLLPLSKDIETARRLDEQEKPAPKVLKLKSGHEVIGRQCRLSGMWFYGMRGTHTSPEAKLTERFKEGV